MALDNKAFTVAGITAYIKEKLQSDAALRNVQVTGEVVGFRKNIKSGHCYFSLKDGNQGYNGSVLNCVMYRNNAGQQQFRSGGLPSDGAQVIVIGKIDLFPPMGRYQLNCEMVIYTGEGDLFARYEALKEKFLKEGLFEKSRKKALPERPGRIGIITSDSGAAVHDIIKISLNRDPGVQLLIYPTKVQGEGAAEDVAEAISFFNRKKLADLLIVGRGGGAKEDLWAFNEEVTVRAIAESEIPIISSVGHETDVTLADFAADMRASTPSNAAELALPDTSVLKSGVEVLEKRMQEAILRLMKQREAQYMQAAKAAVLQNPGRLLELPSQRLDMLRDALFYKGSTLFTEKETEINKLQSKLPHALKAVKDKEETRYLNLSAKLQFFMEKQLEENTRSVENISALLLPAIEKKLTEKKYELGLAAGKLDAVSPLAVLGRGYSLTFNENGRIISRCGDTEPGEKIKVQLADGDIEALVENVERRSQ